MEKNLFLMVGPMGCGKSTIAKELLEKYQEIGAVRISQDEQGKDGHKELFKDSIQDGVPVIIIDRMNFNKQQRNRYIFPASVAGYVINIFVFRTPRSVCFTRIVNRLNHPTIPTNDAVLANKCLDFYYDNYETVGPDEGDNINYIDNNSLLEEGA